MQDNAININKTEQTSECKQIQLPIGGMSCAVCAKRVENGLRFCCPACNKYLKICDNT